MRVTGHQTTPRSPLLATHGRPLTQSTAPSPTLTSQTDVYGDRMHFWLERIADLNTESMRPTPAPGLSGDATGNVGSGESGIRTNAAAAVVSYFSLSSKHCGLVVL